MHKRPPPSSSSSSRETPVPKASKPDAQPVATQPGALVRLVQQILEDPPPEYTEEVENPAEEAEADCPEAMGPQADPYVERVATTNAQYANNAMEGPLTRAEVYQSLSSCYEECGKQVQVVAEQVTVNNVMVSQLAGRIAAAENLMTDHVAKLEERVQVLESILEQELRNPGAVAGAIEQLRMLKDELAGMRQLMDEHPLQVAHMLQALERKTEETIMAAREEVVELRRWMSEDVVPKLRAEMQAVAAAFGEETMRRLAAAQARTLQTVASEMRRVKADMEAAVVSLANHTANISQRQRSVEEMVSQQLATMFVQAQPAQPTTIPSTVSNTRTVAETGMRSISRSRTRSRSADPPATSGVTNLPSPPPTQGVQMGSAVEDMETKVANALISAMQRMGLVAPITSPQMPPSAVAQPQMLQSTVLGSGIPRIDRSRQRGGRPGMGATTTMPVLYNATSSNHHAAAINQVQIAPVGAAASPNMMVTMPVQLSAALLGAVPQRFSGEQQDWPEWRRRWLTFVENLFEAMPTVSDTQILTIFKGVLDVASVEKLEGEQFRDTDVTYEEFFCHNGSRVWR
jgi:hypothetical protein